MAIEHRHPRCVTPSGGAPTEAAVIAELRREVEALTVARNADRTEWMTTYATMRAELEALRCGDLGLFFDRQLSPDRAAAFRIHLATCTRCDAGLLDLAQSKASMKAAKPEPTRGG